MAQPKFSSPFPPLELTLPDKKELCRISKQLVGEVTDAYERFLWQDKTQLDSFRWTLIKEREDVRVYHDRQSGPHLETKNLHGLLTVGTMHGALEDAMYGVVNHTTDAMRVKSAYAKDAIANCAVLATVLEPTLEKPFRSMTVKWGVKSMPLAMRAVSRNRDLVYVESVGTRTLSNGETIGYQLVHSINFKYTQPLPSFVRANVSTCTLWRQQTPERTEIFMKSFVDIPEGFLAPLIVRVTADTLVSVWRGMHVAQMKKLAWLMQRRRASVADDHVSNDNDPHKGYCCAVCGGSANGELSSSSIAASHSSFSSRTIRRSRSSSSSSSSSAVKSTCTICNRFVCAACRVRRNLCLISPSDHQQLVERRVAFCVPCLSVTDRVSAADIARDEISGGRAASVGPLSEIVKGCNSVARFSTTAVVPFRGGCATPVGRSTGASRSPLLQQPRDHATKRRSMTLTVPVKPLPPPSPMYAASMLREASMPMSMFPPPASNARRGLY
jgi:hypothetical protein